jgi:hypothetical protein
VRVASDPAMEFHNTKKSDKAQDIIGLLVGFVSDFYSTVAFVPTNVMGFRNTSYERIMIAITAFTLFAFW